MGELAMNNLGIYVFSGTGNTLKCAEALQKSLKQIGIVPGFHEIKAGTKYSFEKNLVLCYPVHGFNAPKIMLRFCRSLPFGKGSVWFLKTSGEPLSLNDNSSEQMIRILRKKGYRIKGEFHYVMPYNLVFRHTDEMASLMWKTAKERIPKAAKLIAEGRSIRRKTSPGTRLVSRLCRVEHWFYPRNGRLYRVDRKRCVRCMKCVKDCPAGNISFKNGDFCFGKNCTGCVRCAFRCPKGAIHIGILDFMRVTGPYDFTRDPAKATLGRYCKKAYQRYFYGKGIKGQIRNGARHGIFRRQSQTGTEQPTKRIIGL